ncbi:MAG: hypothetical protein ABIJ09_24955 [Pseudomonadota bacterium]
MRTPRRGVRALGIVLALLVSLLIPGAALRAQDAATSLPVATPAVPDASEATTAASSTAPATEQSSAAAASAPAASPSSQHAAPPPSAPAPAPVATPPQPPAAVASGEAPQKGWQESDQAVEISVRGSIEMCEAITLPLVLLPGVGDVIGTVVEWACLLPAVLAVQYVETYHGERDILFWQPAVALVLAKGFRDLVTYPALAIAIAAGLSYAVLAIPALIVAPYFIPVGVAGLLTLGGLGYLGYVKLRDKGSDWVFETSYALLAHGHVTAEQQRAAQQGSWVKPPLTGWTRAWALLAAAGGAEPEFTLLQWIPVAGPWIKSQRWADSAKAVMRQTGREVLSDATRDLEPMDSAIDAFALTDGVLGSAGQTLLVTGGVLFFAGTIFAGLEYQSTSNLGQYAAIAATTGTVGVGVAATGLALVLLRVIPRALRPFVIPALYGFEADPGVEDAAASQPGVRWPWEDATEPSSQPAR